MLKSLSVKNYVLISNLQLDFSDGLTIITGETGAGKSILLGALSLVLGQRADSSVLRNKEDKCIIEALFDVEQYGLTDFFEQYDIDYAPETLIRREISAGGKSRTFINDTPFSLQILKSFGDKLIDVHSQHQNLLLNNESFQLGVLDAFADGISPLLTSYKEELKCYKDLQKELYKQEEKYKKLTEEKAFIQFQFDELDKANLQTGEKEKLEEITEQLDHVEEIKMALSQSYYLLEEQEPTPVMISMKEISDHLQHIQSVFPSVIEQAKRVESIYIELKDICRELEALQDDVEFDPEEAKSARERLDLIYQLERKHQVSSLVELISLRDRYQEQLNLLNNSDVSLSKLTSEVQALNDALQEKATRITKLRKNAIPHIQEKVLSVLHELGMPHARFHIEVETYNEFMQTGCDKVTFLFSANKNEMPNAIHKVASGGEISRFMLAVKHLFSLKRKLPTIIFDEIDTGVSGEIADKMGNIFKDMSANMQVINITHLPQVAAKGDTHLLIYKEDKEKIVQTRVIKLGQEQRIEEIAKMLSGKEITPEALGNARVLLEMT